MGYIDKEKLLHDISVKKARALANNWDLLYTALDEMEKYIKAFPEEKGVSILEDDDVGVSYGDMMGLEY